MKSPGFQRDKIFRLPYIRRMFRDKNRLAAIAIWLIVVAAVVLRIVVWVQNRNLIIDESNVARNLFDRNYLELLKPLDFNQYAPPTFLWATKTFAELFGFGELSLRAYALLCSFGVLAMFVVVGKRIVSHAALAYPLLLLG